MNQQDLGKILIPTEGYLSVFQEVSYASPTPFNPEGIYIAVGVGVTVIIIVAVLALYRKWNSQRSYHQLGEK